MQAVFYFDQEAAETTQQGTFIKTVRYDGKTYVYNKWAEDGELPEGYEGFVFTGSRQSYYELCSSIQSLPDNYNPFRQKFRDNYSRQQFRVSDYFGKEYPQMECK